MPHKAIIDMDNLDTKIESYLLGELSEADRIAFENTLRTDVELQQLVTAHREMMDRLEALRLRGKVKKALLHDGPGRDPASSFTLLGVWLAIGAVFLALAGGYWLYQKQTPPPAPAPMAENPTLPTVENPSPTMPNQSPDTPAVSAERPVADQATLRQKRLLALAQSYYQTPMPTAIRDASGADGAGTETPAQLAAAAFEQEDYALAASILNALKNAELDGDARYLRAHARFKIGQFAGAAADFDLLKSNFLYKYDARWNHLLCLIALGREERAKGMVTQMAAEQDFPFRSKAIDLKEKLSL